MKIAYNGGHIININGLDFEVLSHHFHNPYCDIVCEYFNDENVVTALTVYKDLRTGKYGSEIYKYRPGVNHHYYSQNYPAFKKLPKKYEKRIERLKVVHGSLDFNLFKERPERLA